MQQSRRRCKHGKKENTATSSQLGLDTMRDKGRVEGVGTKRRGRTAIKTLLWYQHGGRAAIRSRRLDVITERASRERERDCCSQKQTATVGSQLKVNHHHAEVLDFFWGGRGRERQSRGVGIHLDMRWDVEGWGGGWRYSGACFFKVSQALN